MSKNASKDSKKEDLKKEDLKKEDLKKEESKKSKDHEDTKKSKDHEESKKSKDHEESKKSKDSKDSKDKDRDSNDEQADTKLDKGTLKAGLKFGINSRKAWFVNFFKGEPEYQLSRTNKETNKVTEGPPKISRAHYSFAAIEQVLCSHFTNLAYEKIEKSKNGLFEITRQSFEDAITRDAESNKLFSFVMKSYSHNTKYFQQLFTGNSTKDTEITKFIENCLDNASVTLSKDGFNFLMFLLHENRNTLTKTMFTLIKYAGKSTISEREVDAAINIHYRDCPTLLDKLRKRLGTLNNLLDSAEKAEGKEKAEKDAKSKKDDKSSKKDDKTSSKKDDKSSKKKEESDSDSDSDDEKSGSDSDSDDE
jgi:hypothetical protein